MRVLTAGQRQGRNIMSSPWREGELLQQDDDVSIRVSVACATSHHPRVERNADHKPRIQTVTEAGISQLPDGPPNS